MFQLALAGTREAIGRRAVLPTDPVLASVRPDVTNVVFVIHCIRDPGYWTHKVGDVAHVLRGAVPHAILLAHTPKRLAEAQQLAVPAVISGRGAS